MADAPIALPSGERAASVEDAARVEMHAKDAAAVANADQHIEKTHPHHDYTVRKMPSNPPR